VETRLAEIRQTDAYRDLVAGLAQASAVPISQIVANPPQARDKDKIAALMSDVEKQRGAKAKADRKAEGPKGPVEGVPMGSYVPGTPDVTADFAGNWVENHGVMLPADFRIFPPAALALIEAGKFERGLARRLPAVLPKAARVLEIGAAVGFMGLHLTRSRPDLAVVMTEDNPSLRQTMQRIMARNRHDFGNRLALNDALLGDNPAKGAVLLAAQVKPQVLLLADPRLTPDILIDLLPRLSGPQPEQILLYGRLLEAHHDALDPVADLLTERGYAPALGCGPGIARGFALVPY